MNINYMTQKALDALNELGNEGSLDHRLSLAWGQLAIINTDYYLQDLAEIRDAFKEASTAFSGADTSVQSEKVQSIIFRILRERGFSDAITNQNSD